MAWLFGDPGPRKALLALALLTVVLLVPFADKAFHIDDPMYLKAAHQITSHPLDPYGFSVNWFRGEVMMQDAMKNPPLASYYIAVMAALFGWSERALHLAFIPFAVAVVLGTYSLARRCSVPPVFAALAVLFSPAFLVSGTTVMCDMMMLALFIWTVVLWIDGIEHRSAWRLMLAGGLAGIAVLTKYFALSLLPLMTAYAIRRRRMTVVPVLAVALFLLIITGYQLWTASLYEHGLLSDAMDYAMERDVHLLGATFVGLGFAGAVLPLALPFTWRLFSRRILVIGSLLALAAASLIVWDVVPTGSTTILSHRPLVAAEMALLILAGLMVVYLGFVSLRPGTGPESMLLGLWLLGTLLFSFYINWTVNARSLLPLAPPAAILLAKRLSTGGAPSIRWSAIALITSLVLSLAVCWGDFRLAGSAREAAAQVMSLTRTEGSTVWFQGHWGFQHYMEERGAKAVDMRKSPIRSGDLVVIPYNNSNTNIFDIDEKYVASKIRIKIPASRWVATQTLFIGAGFYSHMFGPLPFVLGPVPPEFYDVNFMRLPQPAEMK